MDPNHVQNFCANMFSITGRQIDQLRGLLSTGTVSADAATNTIDNITTTPSTQQFGQYFAILLLLVSLVMMMRDNTRGARKENNGPEKPSNQNINRDHRNNGDDGNTSA